MKTAEEKAKEFIEKWKFYTFTSLTTVLVVLLKEQDRDTRHACADAILALPYNCPHDCTGCIQKSEAHAACMNVRAV